MLLSLPFLFLANDKRTLDLLKVDVMNNGDNGTCYTQSQYDKLVEENNAEDWVIVKKEGATHTGDIGSIQNCDSFLRSVKNSLPTVDEKPEGSRAIKLKNGDDGLNWQTYGGLACGEKECPKALASKSLDTGKNGSIALYALKSLNLLSFITYFLFHDNLK